MSDYRVLYTQSDVRRECQVEAAARISELAQKGFRVDPRHVTGPDGYWLALVRHWNIGFDIVNVEQDIVAEGSQIQDMLTCPHEACTIPYRLKGGAWSVYEMYEGKIVPYEIAPEWTSYSGLGLVKFSARIQRHIPLEQYPVGRYEWWGMDMWISGEMHTKGLPWHVHNATYARHVRPNVD